MSVYNNGVDETKDSVDICEEQAAYILALELGNATTQIGK